MSDAFGAAGSGAVLGGGRVWLAAAQPAHASSTTPTRAAPTVRRLLGKLFQPAHSGNFIQPAHPCRPTDYVQPRTCHSKDEDEMRLGQRARKASSSSVSRSGL